MINESAALGDSISLCVALLLIAVVATAVVAPMLFLGQASGHDFEFHIASWFDVARQWHEGILYPRWAEWANWGFGEPRFVFYPPASWMLGAALVSTLPARMAPGALVWLALFLAGTTMWRLARAFLPGAEAAAAAVFFTANPYHLVVVYYRSDFAELLASALFPLLVYGAQHVVHEGWSGVPLLAAVLGGIWLSNAPAAVIATYSVALLFAVACAMRRSWEPALPGAAAMALGLGLAAFFILPAAWEQRWVQIGEALAQDLWPEQNFLFTHASNPEFALFNWKVSSVAAEMILIASLAAVFAARRRREYPELWWMLAALGAESIVFMSRLSIPVWRHLPELRFLQFPWRWLVPLGVVFGFTAAATVGRSRKAWCWWLVLLLVIAGTGTAIVRDAWWDSEDIPNFGEAVADGHGYDGTDEYAPLGCNHYLLPKADRPAGDEPGPPNPRIARLDSESGRIIPASGVRLHFERWSVEQRIFTAESAAPVVLAVRLLNYPAWQVHVDGKISRPESKPKTAQMLLPLAAGTHRVEISFQRTWDRTVGGAISGLTAAGLLAIALSSRKRKETA